MYMVIVSVLLFVVVPSILWYRNPRRLDSENPPSKSRALGCGVISGLIIGVIVGGLIAFAGAGLTATPKAPVEVGRYQLVTLQNEETTTGHFFLASGSIGGVNTYSYWYVDGSGYRHGQLTDKDNVIVYEDQAEGSAYLRKFYVPSNCIGSGWDNWFFCSILTVSDGGYSWEFHVPEGTVLRGIQLH